MNARYVILQVLREAGNGFVKVEECVDPEDNKPDLKITLDRSQIETTGRKAMKKFLARLQLYKSTGDFEKGEWVINRGGGILRSFFVSP